MRSAILSFAIAAAVAAIPAQATVVYQFTIDTNSLIGASGYIDLQFNPGDVTSQMLTAQVAALDLEGGTVVGTPTQVNGDASGTLPGTVTLINDTTLNEYFQAITFGAAVKFSLILSGPGLDAPDGVSPTPTTFGVGFFDSSQNSVLTNDASGFVANININSDGSTNAVFFPNANGGPSVASATSTPEPSTGALCAIAIAALSAAFKSNLWRNPLPK